MHQRSSAEWKGARSAAPRVLPTQSFPRSCFPNPVPPRLLDPRRGRHAGPRPTTRECGAVRPGRPGHISSTTAATPRVCSLSPRHGCGSIPFPGVAGEEVRIWLRGNANNLDPRIELIAPSLTQVTAKNCSASSTQKCGVVETVVLTETGVYLLLVSEAGAGQQRWLHSSAREHSAGGSPSWYRLRRFCFDRHLSLRPTLTSMSSLRSPV